LTAFRQINSRPKARLIDRFELRFLSGSARHIDGLWVGGLEATSPGWSRLEQSLQLIKAHDPLRYRRILRDLERVWVRLLVEGLGSFNQALSACQLDERFVLAETTSPEEIAATIVHEATHARLMRCRIGYPEELRARVEAVCFRRELAFSAKLPNGGQVREQAELRLEHTSPDYWTNESFRDRHDPSAADALKYLGVPNWLIRVILVTAPFIRGAITDIRRLARFFGV